MPGFLKIIPILLMVNLCGYSQTVDHWDLIINSDDEFRYWSSNSGAPDSVWRDTGFDDGAWDSGHGGIGYGDNDDLTVINACNSVSIRKSFTVADSSTWATAWLYVDYDDAFVAYLNGAEIARSDGLADSFPGHLALSTTQHEAGERVEFSIDAAILNQYLLSGENVLAVQVHNATETSSDLSSSLWLIAGISEPGTPSRQVPAWFTEPTDFKESNLPLFIVNTDNNASIPDEPKIDAYLGIIFNGDGEMNHISDPHNHYSGRIGIEIRGWSTSNFPKKPYNFETRDAAGENLNISLFGWTAENDWVLRASYIDHTFIRNGLANYMSRKNGYWASHTRMVELVLNGEYQGIYILMEKIKRDSGRVDIADLYPDEITGPDITGGYIWEISGFESNFGERRNLKYPKPDVVAPEQVAYIRDYDDAFRAAMATGDFADSTLGYHAYINMGSFVNEILVQEAMRNSDAYGWSGYFHKDRLGKICAGPVWDFDQSAGNSSYPDDGVVEGWMFTHPTKTSTPFFWEKLFSNPLFRYALRYRWETLRYGPFSTYNLTAYIDSVASVLSQAQQREFEKWDVLGKFIWRETTGYQDRDSYFREVAYLKNFLTERWAWMDAQLAQYENPYPWITDPLNPPQPPDTTGGTEPPDTTGGTEPPDTTGTTGAPGISRGTSAHPDGVLVYPNPAYGHLNIRITGTGHSSYTVSIYNAQGEMIRKKFDIRTDAEVHVYTMPLDPLIRPGIYFYRIEVASGRYYHGRFIKLE
jgi:hypothetical protein